MSFLLPSNEGQLLRVQKHEINPIIGESPAFAGNVAIVRHVVVSHIKAAFDTGEILSHSHSSAQSHTKW